MILFIEVPVDREGGPVDCPLVDSTPVRGRVKISRDLDPTTIVLYAMVAYAGLADMKIEGQALEIF